MFSNFVWPICSPSSRLFILHLKLFWAVAGTAELEPKSRLDEPKTKIETAPDRLEMFPFSTRLETSETVQACEIGRRRAGLFYGFQR